MRRIPEPLRTASTAVGLSLAVVAVAWLAALESPAMERIAVTMLINVVLVVGLYLFTGLSGVFSFGHMGFMAVGAYVGALLTIPPERKAFVLPELPGVLADLHTSPFMGTVLGGLAAAVVAGLLAVPIMRLSGLTASLATFAMLIIVNTGAENWDRVTGGTGGVSGVPLTTTLGVAMGWAVAAIVAADLVRRSRLGLELQASREDEPAALAVAIRVGASRAAAFVISAFVVGVGGALFAGAIGSFSPDAFYLAITFMTIAMLVVGGTRSLTGAVTGVIVISVVTELLRRAEQGFDLGVVRFEGRAGLREVGLAIFFLVILTIRPRGLTGGRELRLPSRLTRSPR